MSESEIIQAEQIGENISEATIPPQENILPVLKQIFLKSGKHQWRTLILMMCLGVPSIANMNFIPLAVFALNLNKNKSQSDNHVPTIKK